MNKIARDENYEHKMNWLHEYTNSIVAADSWEVPYPQYEGEGVLRFEDIAKEFDAMLQSKRNFKRIRDEQDAELKRLTGPSNIIGFVVSIVAVASIVIYEAVKFMGVR